MVDQSRGYWDRHARRYDASMRLLGLWGKWVQGEVVWRGKKSGRYGVGVRFVGDASEVATVLDRTAVKRR